MKIWVDDVREAPDGWLWCKTSSFTIHLLSEVKRYQSATHLSHLVLEEMSLDHDLGGDDTTRPIVIWMCENDFWPVEVVVHSANPVGREWLEGMIARYKT